MRARGFTLIELLVVLVIIAATTTLLAQGLETTWRNFAKLNTQTLMASRNQMPATWFVDSIEGALLYHPNEYAIVALSDTIEISSFNAPDSRLSIPKHIRWRIVQQGTGSSLVYGNLDTGVEYTILTSVEPMFFSYLSGGEWRDAMPSQTGVLPKAVEIRTPNGRFFTAIVGRPEQADMPPELLMFGQYEFGA